MTFASGHQHYSLFFFFPTACNRKLGLNFVFVHCSLIAPTLLCSCFLELFFSVAGLLPPHCSSAASLHCWSVLLVSSCVLRQQSASEPVNECETLFRFQTFRKKQFPAPSAPFILRCATNNFGLFFFLSIKD